jgi:[ribosomal protein S18]-alanine N-acetyltransferase
MIGTKPLIKIGPQEFTVSSMTEHDLIEVVEIEEQSGLSRWGWDAYHTELSESNGALMFVARLQRTDETNAAGHVGGFVASRLCADELHINNIAVRHAYRRFGIGGALLGAVLKEGARRGARSALLEVRVANEAAQKLYAKYGFKVVARRPNYYTQPLEDALVMSAYLE